MKLIPLFEGELRFDETTEVGFPTHGEDGDWLAYVEGADHRRQQALPNRCWMRP